MTAIEYRDDGGMVINFNASTAVELKPIQMGQLREVQRCARIMGETVKATLDAAVEDIPDDDEHKTERQEVGETAAMEVMAGFWRDIIRICKGARQADDLPDVDKWYPSLLLNRQVIPALLTHWRTVP